MGNNFKIYCFAFFAVCFSVSGWSRGADDSTEQRKPVQAGLSEGEKSRAGKPVEIPPAKSQATVKDFPELEVKPNPFAPPEPVSSARNSSSKRLKIELLATAKNERGDYWTMLDIDGEVMVLKDGDAVNLDAGQATLSIVRISEGVVYVKHSERKELLLVR